MAQNAFAFVHRFYFNFTIYFLLVIQCFINEDMKLCPHVTQDIRANEGEYLEHNLNW